MDLEQIINKLKKDFDYLLLDDTTWKRLVKGAKRSAFGYTEEEYATHFEEYLIKQLTKMVRVYLKDKDNFLIITNNYIALKIHEETLYRMVIKNIFTLLNFYSSMGFNPSLTNLLDLVNTNREVQDMLKVIVDANYKRIQRGIFNFIDNPNLSALIEAYCTLNGIETMPLDPEEIKAKFNNLAYDCDSLNLYRSELDLPVLTSDEEIILAFKARQNDPIARQTLIGRNLPLVAYFAQDFFDKGLSSDDLIQEGCIGLIKAVDRFDATKGVKFSSYAVWWIKNCMRRALYNCRIIRIPENVQLQINKFNSVEEELRNKLFREPSYEEIAIEMGITKEKARALREYQKDISSLNVPINEEFGQEELERFIPSEEIPFEERVCEVQRGDCDSLIASSNLTRKERDVLEIYFGFDGEQRGVLQEIADLYQISVERARQIIAKFLAKMRENDAALAYVNYMDNPERALENLAILRDYYRVDPKNKYKSFYDLLYRKTPEERAQIKSELEKLPNYCNRTRSLSSEKIVVLYDYYSQYYRGCVDIMLTLLSDEFKKIVRMRFGDDLAHPDLSPMWNPSYTELYNKKVVPKMNGLLNRYFSPNDATTEEILAKTYKNIKSQDAMLEQFAKLYNEDNARARKRY